LIKLKVGYGKTYRREQEYEEEYLNRYWLISREREDPVVGNRKHWLTHPGDGFGGLVFSMLASGTRVCGFNPGRSR
jgi:hypothetical protein